MANEYLVFVEAADYFEIEAENEEEAKSNAVEAFKSNSADAAFHATVMREQAKEDDTFFAAEGAEA